MVKIGDIWKMGRKQRHEGKKSVRMDDEIAKLSALFEGGQRLEGVELQSQHEGHTDGGVRDVFAEIPLVVEF
jgi:hypothetical protein